MTALVRNSSPADDPTVYSSHVSPQTLKAAQRDIREAMTALRQLSHSLNDRAYDDDFDQGNLADVAIEKLKRALGRLMEGDDDAISFFTAE